MQRLRSQWKHYSDKAIKNILVNFTTAEMLKCYITMVLRNYDNKKNRQELKSSYKLQNAPSNLASIGRYVLTPDIFDILRNQSTGVGDEIHLADSISKQEENNRVETVLLNGKRFDCGNIQGYIEAIKYIASNYKFD